MDSCAKVKHIMHRTGSKWECMPKLIPVETMSLIINVPPSSKNNQQEIGWKLNEYEMGGVLQIMRGMGARYCTGCGCWH